VLTFFNFEIFKNIVTLLGDLLLALGTLDEWRVASGEWRVANTGILLRERGHPARGPESPAVAACTASPSGVS
jgi:hypothetical protein